MATDKSLKFFRAASAPASAAVGAIWFNTTDGTIQLKTGDSTWEKYAGKLNDASWNTETQKLTITKHDGSSIELDFSQVATLPNVVAAISAAVNPVAERVSTLETEMDAAEGNIAQLRTDLTAETTARTSADTALGERIDGVEDDLAAETSARTQADAEHDRRLTEVEGKVGALSTATHFIGKFDSISLALAAIKAKGDIVIVGNKEYIYNAEVSASAPAVEGNLVELGDTTDEVARIAALETKMGTAEGEIDALQSGLAAEIDRAKKAEKANADAIAAETQRATAAEQANAAAIAQEVTDRANAITAAVNALDATVRGNLSDQDAVSSGHVGVKVVETDGKLTEVKVVEKDIASASDLTALSEKVTTMDGSLGVAKTDITALKALHADGEGGAKKTVKAEITEAVANIKKDSTEVSGGKVTVTYSQANGIVSMQVAESDIASESELSQAKTDISDLKGRMTTAEGNISQLRTDLTAEAATARAAEKANADAIKAEEERAIARENELDAKIGTSIAGALVWEEF